MHKWREYGVFFVFFTHPSFLFYFDKHRHWQIKYGWFAASSAQKSANRLFKLQNYVRRSESRQALDLGGVFSLRFISKEPASLKRTSFYRSSDFVSDSMRSLKTVSLQRWGWKWVVVSHLNDLFDSYVQEQLTLSHFIVISAWPGKERTPNGQVSKWESLSKGHRSDLCEEDDISTKFPPPTCFIYNHWNIGT